MPDLYKWNSDFTFRIDDASGSIANITSEVNNWSITGNLTLLDITGGGKENPRRQHGQGDATISVNGHINSTTEAIFGPLVGTRTSVDKTVCIGNGVKFYVFESLPSSVSISGSPDSLQVWSCDLSLSTGSVSRTSVAAS